MRALLVASVALAAWNVGRGDVRAALGVALVYAALRLGVAVRGRETAGERVRRPETADVGFEPRRIRSRWL